MNVNSALEVIKLLLLLLLLSLYICRKWNKILNATQMDFSFMVVYICLTYIMNRKNSQRLISCKNKEKFPLENLVSVKLHRKMIFCATFALPFSTNFKNSQRQLTTLCCAKTWTFPCYSTILIFWTRWNFLPFLFFFIWKFSDREFSRDWKSALVLGTDLRTKPSFELQDLGLAGKESIFERDKEFGGIRFWVISIVSLRPLSQKFVTTLGPAGKKKYSKGTRNLKGSDSEWDWLIRDSGKSSFSLPLSGPARRVTWDR